MKKILFLLSVLSLALLTGCSSIVRGSDQNITFNASQTDSKIQVKDTLTGIVIAEGKDSLTVDLKRGKGFFEKGDYTIVVSKKGFETVNIPLTGKADPYSYGIGNLVSFSFVGWLIVDPMTGAMWTLSTPDGKDGKKEPITIVLKENVTGEMLDKATPLK